MVKTVCISVNVMSKTRSSVRKITDRAHVNQGGGESSKLHPSVLIVDCITDCNMMIEK